MFGRLSARRNGLRHSGLRTQTIATASAAQREMGEESRVARRSLRAPPRLDTLAATRDSLGGKAFNSSNCFAQSRFYCPLPTCLAAGESEELAPRFGKERRNAR